MMCAVKRKSIVVSIGKIAADRPKKLQAPTDTEGGQPNLGTLILEQNIELVAAWATNSEFSTIVRHNKTLCRAQAHVPAPAASNPQLSKFCFGLQDFDDRLENA